MRLSVVPLVVTSLLITRANAAVKYTGVSQAGLEFNLDPNGPQGAGSVPGNMNEKWFPPSNASMDYFRSLGSNVVRLPFIWERIQSTLFSALNTSYATVVDSIVTRETNNGSYIVLDLHNYGKYYGSVIGSQNVSADAFYDLWTKIATKYKANDKVVFSIMDQPREFDTRMWWETYAQGALNAIRNAGASNMILVQGTCGAFGHVWFNATCGQGTISNADASLLLSDPLGKTSIDIHQFIDPDRNGGNSNGACSTEFDFISNINNITTWLREHGRTAWLGEFAIGQFQTCYTALSNLLPYLETNSDVWVGWVYWAAGSAWGGWWMGIEPSTSGSATPQTAIFKDYLVERESNLRLVANNTSGNNGGGGRVGGQNLAWMVGALVGVFGVVSAVL
ncbi:hypothetical protein HDV00_006859 [Rhizophlyctis rosea]|nr:hypothetical protein HDV00_006859 [Rhizophlyctis rosea]